MASREDTEPTGLEVAVVGLVGRFPGAPDLERFWDNLRAGRESISFFEREELLAAGVDPDLVDHPSYVPACGVLDGADRFDADFFGYSPREAEVMDPQHRLFLETAWEALENAGHDPRDEALVGVYAGVSSNTYLIHLYSSPELLAAVGDQQVILSNEKDFLANRVAYKIGLGGPAVVVQSACSTSLLAVHQACQSLLSGECDLALAGGVSVSFPQTAGHLYHEGGIVSPDGHCRAFDADAAGTVGGHGVGVVVLKRLEDALADGDRVHAVVRGSAVTNDGADRAGYTAPGVAGQVRVVRAAHRMAEVAPETIGYVEAHGTATQLGDPIEVEALHQAFQLGSEYRDTVALGSVKTNIGHLDAAAGIAGFLKAVLAVERGEIPPSLHYGSPNPEIDFAAGPFRVARELQPWPVDRGPRRAGVSSFGLGGTNVHVVLEQAPGSEAAEPAAAARAHCVLPLSARDLPALDRLAERLADHLDRHRELDLADIAHTLQRGRRPFEHRRALVVRDLDDAVAALRGACSDRQLAGRATDERRSVIFLLPGLGDLYPGLGAGLYRSWPVYRQVVDQALERLSSRHELDLEELLVTAAGGGNGADDGHGEGEGDDDEGTSGRLDLKALLARSDAPADDPASRRLRQTDVAHPALFTVQVALGRLWRHLGIEPTALLGYSLGELAAAHLAGVIGFDDALDLVVDRARLIAELPPGGMLAVPLDEESTRRLVAPDAPGAGLSVAAVNGPEVTVVAGRVPALERLAAHLEAEGRPCRRLETEHAFHSAEMEPIAERFRRRMAEVELTAPEIPYVSNVTGTWIEAEQATDPDHWVRHLVGTVRFARGVGELLAEPGRIFLELGPGQSLGSLVVQQAQTAPAVVSSLRHRHEGRSDDAHLASAIGRLWVTGIEPDWTAFQGGERRRKVPLPTYPFDRKRYWFDGSDRSASEGASPVAGAGSVATGRTPEPSDWFHAPSWRTVPLAVGGALPEPRHWLLLGRDGAPEASTILTATLEGRGHRVTSVVARPGLEALERAADGTPIALDPASDEQWAELFRGLSEAVGGLVHLARLGALPETDPAAAEALFWELLVTGRSWARVARVEPAVLALVADGLFRVERRDRPTPARAVALGPLQVLPLENPGLRGRAVDFDPDDLDAAGAERLARELEAADVADPLAVRVAWRGDLRWLTRPEPRPLPPVEDGAPVSSAFGSDRVVLVTGGLGGIGLALAQDLARRQRLRLVLVGRRGLPPRERWQALLDGSTGADDSADRDLSRRLDGVRSIEAAGSEVMVAACDVADPSDVRRLVEEVRERWGTVDAVLHAAGVPGGGLAALKRRPAAAAVLAPKVAGAFHLEAALADDPPALWVLFSSLAVATGELGQVDYVAANAFLDALAQSRKDGPGRWLAVDWCEWRWDAWSELSGDLGEAARQHLARHRERFGLDFDEGADALRRAIASGLEVVAVATTDLQAELEQRHGLDAALEDLARELPSGGHDRPDLAVEMVPPDGPVEETIADIWRGLLGLGVIGRNDPFFELGGHSLLGTQMVARIEQELGVSLPLSAIFDAPTIARLAVLVTAGRKVGELAGGLAGVAETERQREIQQSVDDLDDAEVDSLLAELLAEEGNARP